MAKNGTLKTNTVYDSYFWVQWEESSQDIPNNKTQIKWSCGVYCGHDFFTNAIRMDAVTINGTKVYNGGTYSNYYAGNHTIATGTIWIAHNEDGTKTFTISKFTGWLYRNNNYSRDGESFELTPIPRKATITEVSDFTDVDNPSFTFDNPGNFPMDVWLEPNPIGDHLCVRENIENTGSFTWDLSDEERDALRNKCAGKSCTIRVGLYTYVSDTTYSDYKDKTYTMTENDATKPSVAMNVTLNNDLLDSKFGGMYIQGKSKLDVELSADGKFGADIKSYSAVIDGKTYNSQQFTSDVLQGVNNANIVGYAKDSRDFTGSTTQRIRVVPYSKPLVIPLSNENAILCYRSDGNGKRVGSSTSVWIKAKMSYYVLLQKNQCALQWRRKSSDEEWNDTVHLWHNLIEKTDADTYEYNALIDGDFDKKKSYTVQIRAIDDVGEFDFKTFEIPTEDVALHLGKGGKNVSVGTYCDYSEDYTFYSDWDAYFDKDVYIGDKKINDFVVEQGTSGIWEYRKWASGIAECWGQYPVTGLEISQPWGSLFEPEFGSSITADFPSGLFYSAPILNMSVQNASAGILSLEITEETTKDKTCRIWPTRATEGTGLNCTIAFRAIGRWK